MARAKQTARAEARRRTRQEARAADLAELDAADVEAADADTAAAPNAGRAAQTSGSRPVPARPGFGSFFSSFGSAYRRPNVGEDLRFLPSLLLRRGFLAAVALMIVGALSEIAFPGYSGSNFLFQFLTYPPALAPIFIAGFFAPRASYLLGLAAGVVDVLVLLIWAIAASPALGAAASPQNIVSDLLPALVSNAITGVVFGAGAAWYRRFLQSTSPRRQGQGGKGQSSRGQAGRRAAAATSGRRRY